MKIIPTKGQMNGHTKRHIESGKKVKGGVKKTYKIERSPYTHETSKKIQTNQASNKIS